MTRTVLVAPHNDDEVLFGAYLIQRARADVVVVLKGRKQEPAVGWETRARESQQAVSILRHDWPNEDEPTDPAFSQWRFSDADPDWQGVREALDLLATSYDHAIVPAVELSAGAHEQHNVVGDLAAMAFGPGRVTRYLTYDRLAGRSTHGQRVEVEDPEWVWRKLAALSCYRSQITDPSTRPHFERGLDEYVLP